MTYEIRPIGLRQAREFVQEHHRHHNMPQGGLWAICLLERGVTSAGNHVLLMVGVAIAGRPVSRVLDRAGYCEVVRLCVLEGHRNACSFLYARCRRIAQAMGYAKTITYTLASESGASLRAAGFRRAAESPGGSWSVPSRRRRDSHPLEPKVRWESP